MQPQALLEDGGSRGHLLESVVSNLAQVVGLLADSLDVLRVREEVEECPGESLGGGVAAGDDEVEDGVAAKSIPISWYLARARVSATYRSIFLVKGAPLSSRKAMYSESNCPREEGQLRLHAFSQRKAKLTSFSAASFFWAPVKLPRPSRSRSSMTPYANESMTFVAAAIFQCVPSRNSVTGQNGLRRSGVRPCAISEGAKERTS